jgi:hypothetical protein
MTPLELRAIIKRFPQRQPMTKGLSRALALRGQLTCPPQHPTQKELWLSWLSDYDGPGASGRQTANRSAAFATTTSCPPMLMWLAEASGFHDRCYCMRLLQCWPRHRCSPANQHFYQTLDWWVGLVIRVVSGSPAADISVFGAN